MPIVNTFSLSVSGATFPKPTLVMQVIVKYKAVTYIVLRGGPEASSCRKAPLGVPVILTLKGC